MTRGRGTRIARAIPARSTRVACMIVYLIAFSAGDLALTLLYTIAGVFEEQNPIARTIITDHGLAQLAAFKIGATGLGLSLLYTLRRQPLAEAALWFVSSVVSLVAARWMLYIELACAAEVSPI